MAGPSLQPADEQGPSVLPEGARLMALARVAGSREVGLATLRELWPEAEVLLVLGPLGVEGALILEASGMAAVGQLLPLPMDHPLRGAWEVGTTIQWRRPQSRTLPGEWIGNVFPGTTIDAPRLMTHQLQQVRVLPLEALAVPLAGGRVLVVLEYRPGRSFDEGDAATAQLLGASGSSPREATSSVPWGTLAERLVGAPTVREVLAIGLDWLAAQIPEAQSAVIAVDLAAGTQTVLAVSEGVTLLTSPSGTLPINTVLQLPLTAGRSVLLADWTLHRRSEEETYGAKGMMDGAARWLAPLVATEGGPPWGILMVGHRELSGLRMLDEYLEPWVALVEPARAVAERLEKLEAGERRQQDELLLAESIQRSFLPAPLNAGAWSLRAHQDSDRALAGDFVLAEASGEHLLLAIGDVSGRGIPASLTMMAAFSLLQSQLVRGGDLPAIVAAWSQGLWHMAEPNQVRTGVVSYVTAVVLRINRESGVVEFVKAGHTLPILARADGSVESWDGNGYPAGLFAVQEFELVLREIAREESLLLFTDGLNEARGLNGPLGTARLEAIMQRFGRYPAAVIEDQVLLTLEQHLAGQPVNDDTTLAVLARAGAEWGEASGVRLNELVACASGGSPRVAIPKRPAQAVVATDLKSAWEELAQALPILCPETPDGGWRMRWCDGEQVYLGAINIPAITLVLPGCERPSQCMALLGQGGHPLRGFARLVDFCWVDFEAEELLFARQW